MTILKNGMMMKPNIKESYIKPGQNVSEIFHYLKHGRDQMKIENIVKYNKLALEVLKTGEFSQIHAFKEINTK